MRLFAVGQEPVGVIALGQVPTGIIAVGQGATGLIAVGQLARGFVAIGQLTVGVFAFGQLALGIVWAGGQLAVGGTTSVSMVGFGVLGRFVPWRRASFAPTPIGRPLGVTWRVVALGIITAAVTVFALYPVADAILRVGGIFRSPPPILR
jgi:hypothetical protein